MPVPHMALTDSQYRLLAELALGDLPAPGHEPGLASARGLDPETVRTDVPALSWMGLVAVTDGNLSATALGTAVLHRTERENAEIRLAEVAAFADALELADEPGFDHRRASHALRNLAQGAFSLEEAVGYLS